MSGISWVTSLRFPPVTVHARGSQWRLREGDAWSRFRLYQRGSGPWRSQLFQLHIRGGIGLPSAVAAIVAVEWIIRRCLLALPLTTQAPSLCQRARSLEQSHDRADEAAGGPRGGEVCCNALHDGRVHDGPHAALPRDALDESQPPTLVGHAHAESMRHACRPFLGRAGAYPHVVDAAYGGEVDG
jgi:hypothetical protein